VAADDAGVVEAIDVALRCSLYGGKLAIDEYFTDSSTASRLHRDILLALLCGTGRFGPQGSKSATSGSTSTVASTSTAAASSAWLSQMSALLLGSPRVAARSCVIAPVVHGLPSCAFLLCVCVCVHSSAHCQAAAVSWTGHHRGVCAAQRQQACQTR
jgi:hypothetical protein